MEASVLISFIMIISTIILSIKEHYIYDLIKTVHSIHTKTVYKEEETKRRLIISIEFTYFNHLKKFKK